MNKITGLFKSVSKKGVPFLSGKTLEGVKCFVFKNNLKQDNQPDYFLYFDDSDAKSNTYSNDKKQLDNDYDFPF